MSASEWTVWEHQSFFEVVLLKVVRWSHSPWNFERDEVQWISLIYLLLLVLKLKFGSNGSLNLERMWFNIQGSYQDFAIWWIYISVLGYSTVYLVWGSLICVDEVGEIFG